MALLVRILLWRLLGAIAFLGAVDSDSPLEIVIDHLFSRLLITNSLETAYGD